MMGPHGLRRRDIDFGGAANYVAIVTEKERSKGLRRRRGRTARESAPNEMETAMKFSFIRRFFQERRVYWSVIHELSAYTDRELRDLGVDRADIEYIAREAARA